jgi:GntR family transcriptional regulator
MAGHPVKLRSLRRHATTPLYVQIRDDIVARIRDRDLQPGERVPSEPELVRSYGVGRPTVRQAIDMLRREGLVVTVRGSGTFVAHDSRRISLLGFDGLSNSLRARNIDFHDTVLDSDVYSEPPLDVLSLHEPGTKGWWAVRRLRVLVNNGDKQPLCVETDAFNLEHCPDAAELFTESGSATAVLEDGYGYAIARCDAASRAVNARDSGTVKLLGIPPTTPLLAMERLNWSPTGDPIHIARFVIRTDLVPVVERLVNPTITA